MNIKTETKLEERRLIDEIFRIAEENSASDIQLTAGAKPHIRTKETFIEAGGLPVLTSADTEDIAFSLVTDIQKEKLKKCLQVDFSFGRKNARYRANIYHQRSSISISMRRLKSEIPTIKQLHLPEFLPDFMRKKAGIIIVSGPTGSGKSTTIASMLKTVIFDGVHIITIEDPIEYLIPHGNSIVDQREVGTDVLSFDDGMKAVVRENPDIIFIGEIRDPESAKIVLSLATTGHLVVTTIHAFPAIEAIDRMLSLLSDKEWNRKLFAMSFITVISQMLVNGKGNMYPAVEVIEHSKSIQQVIIEGRLNEITNYMNSQRCLKIEDSLRRMQNEGYIDDYRAVLDIF